MIANSFQTTGCRLLVLLAVLLASRSVRSGEQPSVFSFLEKHCHSCHGKSRSKGDLTLHDLAADFADDGCAGRWQLVLEKLETGGMPPRKRPRPAVQDVRRVTRWIRRELAKAKRTPAIDHKLRSAEFGNHLDHAQLFDGSHKGPAYSRSRLWRLSPQIYDRFIRRLGGGLRHAAAIHQPFAVDEAKGVITDYAAQHFADSATLQLLMMNCRTIAEYQTTGIVKREHDGRLHRERNTPREFRAIIESDTRAGAEQIRAAIAFEYRLLLEREPTDAEMAESVAFCERATEKAGNVRGLQTALMSILLKPESVYRLEIGLGPGDEHGRRRLSSHELAFALAFALTEKVPSKIRVRVSSDADGEPDGEPDGKPAAKSLLELAEEGALSTPEEIRRVVKQILDDNNMADADYTMFAIDHRIGNTRVLRFFRDFFGYHHATRVFKDEKRIGIDSGFETERMVEDADQLVMHIFDEDRDVLRRLLTTDEYFIAYPGSLEKIRKEMKYIRNNKDDANFKDNTVYIRRAEAKGRHPIPIEGTSSRTYVGFYNLDHEVWDYPTNQPFRMPGGKRAGILTHPAWLIAWSGNFDNDPIRRGKWIREHLLAGTVPDVPITVNAVVPEDPHKTLRQRLEANRAEYCWGCHEKMNPLGLPFESFDDFGRYRTEEMIGETLSIFPRRHRDAKRVPANSSGEIVDSGEESLDGKVSSALELVRKLADSTRVRQSFVRHAFRFWMGRNETFDDSPTLIAADDAYTKNGGSMKALIASLLSSESFLYRK